MIKWLAAPAVALSLASTTSLAALGAGFTGIDNNSLFCGNVT